MRIYGLIDPRTKEIRYVGKSDNPVKRLRRHLGKKNIQKSFHAARWLRSLVEIGLKPEIAILEVVSGGENWEDRERHWIAYLRSEGCDLTNTSPGGEGGATYGRLGKKNSEEHKRNCSLARKGVSIKKASPGDRRRAANAESWRRRKAAAEAIGQPVRVKPRSEESKLKMSAIAKAQNRDMRKAQEASRLARQGKPSPLIGRKASQETRDRISASKKGKPWTEARRLAQSKRKASEEE